MVLLSAITGLELVFVLCALLGGGLFFVRMVLMFFAGVEHSAGGDASAMDAAHSVETNIHHDAGATDSDVSFKTLSLQGVTAFFMMFGLVGWAMLRQSKQSETISILTAVAAGAATVWLIKKIFQWAGTLQSSGTLNLNNAVGCQGTVYLTIKPGQTGKVQITIQERLAELDARSQGTEELPTGQTIRVVKVINNLLVVEKI